VLSESGGGLLVSFQVTSKKLVREALRGWSGCSYKLAKIQFIG
jgi:hypothetical protein